MTTRNRSRRPVKTQSGAFDLPSILIGVAVVAILAIGVMATIFGVIPWAQDRAAKQDLAAITTAQGTTYAHAGSFTNKAALVADGWIGDDTPEALDARTDAEGKCYVAVTTSKTGNRFIVSSDKPTPREVTGSDTWCSGGLVSPDTSPVMISTWDTSLAANCKELTLPNAGSDFKGTVNWGDGVTDTKTSHTYATTGEVQIRIDGTFSRWGSDYAGADDLQCLRSVDRWGATGTTDLDRAFYNADNLRHVETIPPTATTLVSAFGTIDSAFTIGQFDTSKVTNMNSMFGSTAKFNQPVEFDTSQVTDMSGMFANTKLFDQPVPFDTSNVTRMSSMFSSAEAFNQPVKFDTSKVASLDYMFAYAAVFDQAVEFETSKVRDMSGMFKAAREFDQPVNFNTSEVVTMYEMFTDAQKFNQPVRFNTSKVRNMSRMFYWAAAFNHPVDFDTSKVTDMSIMFSYAKKFDQPVNFDTSQVTDMSVMFNNAELFNQPLNFDTSQVTNMSYMFNQAWAFRQDLSGWNVKKVVGWDSFGSMPLNLRPKFGEL